jgi:hypothetical protein
MCYRCVAQDAPHIADFAEKIAAHQAAGTLDQYPLEQRLADLGLGQKAPEPVLTAKEKKAAHLNFKRKHGGRGRNFTAEGEWVN